MHDPKLLIQLEQLRKKMIAAAGRKPNIVHQDVLLLSQMLDQLIFKVQVEKRARQKSQ